MAARPGEEVVAGEGVAMPVRRAVTAEQVLAEATLATRRPRMSRLG